MLPLISENEPKLKDEKFFLRFVFPNSEFFGKGQALIEVRNPSVQVGSDMQAVAAQVPVSKDFSSDQFHELRKALRHRKHLRHRPHP